ncbi:HAD family hydrolase [Shouchella shacheensis]|uniref:HAD family hydrolase n=1 Tax=Shouchella shacheensis TaxID=1649580 RepID=UPI0007404C18|nr:HAD family hydrolase [Shouchella shacheensis]
MLDRYKLVVFDLDGTLYEGTDHFDFYADHLKANVAKRDKAEFQLDYEAMKAGNHVVQIGKAYDVQRDAVLSIDPMTLRVTAVHDWEGESWSEEEASRTYPGGLSFNFEDMIAIGDGWWYPFVCAKHHGVRDCYSSYLATKEYMVSDEFTLEPLEGLRENLLQLKNSSQIVLMTNSDHDDVGRLFKELGLEGVFEHSITSATKPSQTDAQLAHLLKHYDVQPEEAVSIGDNFINEIAPAVLLGMDAVYIHPQKPVIDKAGVQVVASVTDCF